jgi:predicted nucleic acid-binding protein
VRLARDPEAPARRSADPGDDYLVALAEAGRAVLVSGDRHLHALAGELPILAPRAFLGELSKA